MPNVRGERKVSKHIRITELLDRSLKLMAAEDPTGPGFNQQAVEALTAYCRPWIAKTLGVSEEELGGGSHG